MFNIHLEFMLSRRTTLLLLVSTIILACFYVYYGNFIWGYSVLDGDREGYLFEYVYEAVFLLEFFLLFLAVTTSVQMFSYPASGYVVYLVRSRMTKLKAITAKIGALILFDFMFVFGQLLMFYLIARLLSPLPLSFATASAIFARLLAQMAYFSILQALLMQLINNYLTAIIPLALFWIMAQTHTREAIAESRIMIMLNTIIPNLICENGTYSFYKSDATYMLGFACVTGLLVLAYMNKDI